MFSLLGVVRTILEAADFHTVSPQPDADFFHFEDISLMGQVRMMTTPEVIVAQWEKLQDDFLQTYAPRLLRDSTKAWNLYTILLTPSPAPKDFLANLFAIEEDFRGTRKIVRAGIASREDILAALGPLLPIQNLLVVRGIDAKQRLSERLGSLHTALGLLATDAVPQAIATALVEGA